MTEIEQKIQELAKHFCLQGELQSVTLISNGNINTTYDVVLDQNGIEGHYVFQKINMFVFKSPKKIMSNIEKITRHIADKLESEGKEHDQVMHFFYTADGKNYYLDDNGFWRVSEYVRNTVTYNECDNLSRLRSAGSAFGNFQNMLADFDATTLYETIPNFHNTRSRIAVFFRHVNEDPCGRVDEVREEIEQIRKFKPLAQRLNELIDSQELPMRVTHNDTKINNILFDKDTDEAKTVIDLDTVMPGLVAYDFGDAIRMVAAISPKEDEQDLSKVKVDMTKFETFTKGFVHEVKDAITKAELDSLAMGALAMTTECGIRFLADYLDGDKYFRIHYPDQNLVRARRHLVLAQDMLKRMDELKAIVQKYCE